MNHIQIYDNALPKESCHKIIDYFEFGDVSKDIGKTWDASGVGKVDKNFKDSTDLYLNMDNTHHRIEMDISKMIIPTLQECIEKYKKKFPQLTNNIGYWKCVPYYNIQRFSEGQGYHQIHCEATTRDVADRILVWMIYLNNAKCGTRFYYPRRDICAREGRVVIWPAAWTHPHSGITPNKGDKYIATGWYAFQ